MVPGSRARNLLELLDEKKIRADYTNLKKEWDQLQGVFKDTQTSFDKVRSHSIVYCAEVIYQISGKVEQAVRQRLDGSASSAMDSAKESIAACWEGVRGKMAQFERAYGVFSGKVNAVKSNPNRCVRYTFFCISLFCVDRWWKWPPCLKVRNFLNLSDFSRTSKHS